MTLKLGSARAKELSARVSDLLPQGIKDLESLVRIPSINFPGHDPAPVHHCANAVADLLRAAGAPDVQLVPSSHGVPAVVADIPGPKGSPTVVLYAHYDVQPPGDLDAWSSEPFEPETRGSRMYGRGTADDKACVVGHIVAVRAFGGKPPVGLRIVMDGEEEYGGDTEEWPFIRPDFFGGVDAAVVADMGNAALGQPSFATQVRGVVDGVVTVRTLESAVHSGAFGGPAPDALMVLVKLLSTLVDENGDCAIVGIGGFEWEASKVPEHIFREAAGVLPDQPLVGTGSIASRLFSRPAVSAVGLDAPTVASAANAIIPAARARISVRIPPEVDATGAAAALAAHVHRHAPFGARIDFEPGAAAAGAKVPLGGPAYRACAAAMDVAYGRPPVNHGVGGTVPLIANMLEAFPGMEVLGVGAQDPGARIHGPNESVDLEELAKVIEAEVLFLAEFGAAAGGNAAP